MHLTVFTPPTLAIVSLPEVKEQARVVDGDDDALLTGLRDAAVQWMDGWSGVLGRALATQTWDMHLPWFPEGAIVLPLGPVASVVSIVYRNAAGAEVTVDPLTYRVAIAGGHGTVTPVASWPAAGDFADAVRVRWICGQAVADIPHPIRLAARVLAAHWYDQRGADGDVPDVVWSLIAPYRRRSL